MTREPSLCVPTDGNVTVKYSGARTIKRTTKRAIPRCEFGFLHQESDWICPHHENPKIVRKVQSRNARRKLGG